MRVLTRRWNDPAQAGDGLRILVTRYRPRGVRKEDETWDVWRKDLSPSAELLSAFQGKSGEAIPWSEFARRYKREMKAQQAALRELATEVASGTVTLLCASSCEDEKRCHRSVLRELLLDA